MVNQGETIYLRNDDFKIKFHINIPTKTGYVAAINIMTHTEAELANLITEIDK